MRREARRIRRSGRVRLGQGGLIFTVIPAGGDSPDEEERPVKMTTEVRLRKRGRDVSR